MHQRCFVGGSHKCVCAFWYVNQRPHFLFQKYSFSSKHSSPKLLSYAPTSIVRRTFHNSQETLLSPETLLFVVMVVCTGSFKRLGVIKFRLRAVKMQQIKFSTCAFFFHFGTFCVVVLQLILASKLGELEEFENWTANSQFASKYEFSG